MTINTQRWEILQLIGNPRLDPHIIKLNALGSLYYFAKFVLQRGRLTEHLHKPICENLERQRLNYLLELPRDHFKALAVDTKIPTPLGFKSLGCIKTGDFVYNADGQLVKVIGESEVTFRPVFEVEFSTGDVIKCDAEHLWLTDAKRDRENAKNVSCPTVKTTDEIADTLKCCKEYNHRVPVAKEMFCYDRTLIVSPYTLGAWLGDGCSADGRIACNDPEIISRIREDGYIVTKQKAKFMYGIAGLRSSIRNLGVIYCKHIPDEYLFSGSSQRLDLLRGLMDTDGSISKAGQCSFSNTNYELVSQVRTLLCSLGYKPSPIGTYRSRLNGEYVGWFHVVTFYAYPEKSPFHLSRKTKRLYAKKSVSLQGYRQIVDIRPVGSEYVKCIKIDSPDGLYLAGEGFIPTHNTTMMTEALPIWWALPFTDNDEAAMRELGYGDEWIRWMKFAHNPLIRILIVSEAALNAEKLGMRIDQHFYNNGRFRDLFPEIVPNEKSTWNASSKCVGGSKFRPHGEGTFDFIGVGGALQSRHYDRMIEDDLVGKDALRSEIIMADTIEYHKLLEGAFDGPDHTELVVGNRWSPTDLNGWIRENEPEFVVESHSALGGCCADHEPGKPILPEEFDIARLEKIRRRQGAYLFSHQYLNEALSAEDVVFKPEWLRYYKPKPEPFMQKLVMEGEIKQIETNRMLLEHEVVKGTTYSDIPVNRLVRSMTVDPNHSGSEGRARHAIVVTGLDPDTDQIYLLDIWAQSMPYDDLTKHIYSMCERWKLTEFWLETVAAQKYLKYHLEYRNKIENRNLRCRELKTDRGKHGKWTRIDALSPLFEQGKVFIRRDQSAFITEYTRYSHSARQVVDVLDAFSYAPQTWSNYRFKEIAAMKEERKNRMGKRSRATGY